MKFLLICSFVTCFFRLQSQTIAYSFVDEYPRIINAVDTITVYWKIDSSIVLKNNNRTYYGFFFGQDTNSLHEYLCFDPKTKDFYYIAINSFENQDTLLKVRKFSFSKRKHYKLDEFFPNTLQSRVRVRKKKGVSYVFVKDVSGFTVSEWFRFKGMVFENTNYPTKIILNKDKEYVITGKVIH